MATSTITLTPNKAMVEMAALRNQSIESYLLALADADRANIRIEKITALPLAERPEKVETKSAGPRKKLDAIAVQKVLHLRNSMNVADLARRFGVGTANILRILRAHDASAHDAGATHTPTGLGRRFVSK